MTDTDRREALWAAGRKIVLDAPQLYIDVDIEADGIAGHGSMLSLGAQSPTGESFYREIQPISEAYIPANRAFAEAHGLAAARLRQEGTDPGEVMVEFAEWLDGLVTTYGKPPIFTAFNAGFDWSFVNLYFRRAGVPENPFGITPLDLKSLALPLTERWDWAETAKGRLPAVILPDGDFVHQALEDARYQQKIHFGLAAILRERGFRKRVASASRRRDPSR